MTFKISDFDKNIETVIANARTIVIRNKTAKFCREIDNNEGKIQSVNYDDGLKLEIGDKLILDKDGYYFNPFIIKQIDKYSNPYSYLLSSNQLSKNYYFIFPLIINSNYSKDYYGYSNCLYNTLISEDKKQLIVILRFQNKETYSNLEKLLTSCKNYEKQLYVHPSFSAYTFNISSLEKEVNLFFNGEYSKFSSTHKKTIEKFFNGSYKDSEIYNILHKTEKKKKQLEEKLAIKLDSEQELCSKPKIEEEIFYRDNFNE